MAACDSRFAGKKRATVPELYRKAAKVLKSAEQRKESVKNLIYSSGFRVSLVSVWLLCYFGLLALSYMSYVMFVV